MRSGVTWSGAQYLGTGLLILFSPLLLAVAWSFAVVVPWNLIDGLGGAFSGRDVVQVADGFDMGVSLLLLLLILLGAGWLLRLRLPIMVVAYGTFLVVPAAAGLGAGAEYGLQAVLARRGYDYCTFHVTSRGRTEEGVYVYVRDQVPGACDAMRTAFPPHQPVPDGRAAFDLPMR